MKQPKPCQGDGSYKMVCPPATKCQHYGSEGLFLRVAIRRPSTINVMQQPSTHLQLSLGRLIAIAVPLLERRNSVLSAQTC